MMTGLDAIGGSVNFVSRQPTTGPIKSELDTSIDSLGTYRTHFGSGGSTTVPGLDYRFDVSSSKINSFIDGDYREAQQRLGAAQLPRQRLLQGVRRRRLQARRRPCLLGHAAVRRPRSPGPSPPTASSRDRRSTPSPASHPSPVTVDSRTTTTNYNVADNSIGAHELWLRGGFEWAVNDDITIKDQAYEYGAKRHWLDSETYAFNPDDLDRRPRPLLCHPQAAGGRQQFRSRSGTRPSSAWRTVSPRNCR